MTSTTTPAPGTLLAVPSRTYPSLRSAAVPLAALCLAFFVEMVDNTLLTVALPTIGRELGASTTALQWVLGAYSLTFGGLLLTAGSAADRLGRRRVLLAGLAGFGALSLLVVAVTTAGQLVALRAALGVAAAAMAPITASLVFRLFDTQALRMRAMTVMVVVGMSGFVLGPLLGGTALAHVSWQWLLLVNAPVALLAWVGVRVGVPADDPAGLTGDRPDVPGSLLSTAAVALACWTATSGVQHGWTSAPTAASAAGAVLALVAFVRRERRTAHPVLDLALFHDPVVRGAALAQVGTSVAMAGVMFTLVLHFQDALGWSPVRAGLANLPLVVTMVLASPVSEALAARLGHRVACLLGAGLLAGSLVALAWGVGHGYPVVAAALVTFTLGLRTVMTICAVALVEAVPAERTSLGAALNDTAQEIGSTVGTAVVGTLVAVLVTTVLPTGGWTASLVASFLHGERVVLVTLAVLVALLAGGGALSLTASRSVDEHAADEHAG